jgi:putative intracellular protease/amidase
VSRVLVPLPDRDFDPTEAAIPWQALRRAGHEVVFATEHGGSPPAADPVALQGIVLGRFGASAEAKAVYRELEAAPEFRAPASWTAIDPEAFDGLLLPGGHAPGMKQYLGSEALQAKVAAFQALDRPVGAICHGVLVPARAGVLRQKRTTCLPKYLERLAFYGTFWTLGRYTRTYPEYVEDEVRAAAKEIVRGPGPRKPFALVDGNYVSARWYGDAELFAQRFIGLL